jgi:Predicted membrane protein (DUF2339)
MPDEQERTKNVERLAETLANLEARLSRIEEELKLEPIPPRNNSTTVEGMEAPAEVGDNLELRIGLYWFAKVGIVALIIGVVFLLLQPYPGLYPVFASLLGFLLAGGLTVVSRTLKKSSPLLSGYLLGGGLVLFFFAALRLHYFSAVPVLGDRLAEIAILLVTVGVSLAASIRQRSVYLVSISLTLGFVSGLMSENLYTFYSITLVMAILTLYVAVKYGWPSVLIYGMSFTYVTNLAWLLNNPLVGNQVAFRPVPYGAEVMVLFWAILFAAGISRRVSEDRENIKVILGSLLNASLGYALFFILAAAKFQDMLAVSNIAASLVFLALAVISWSREKSRFQTFFYAMTGYAALSVAIIAGFKTPDFFILLCWQSLLVVSTAVWFRSKFIVVANFVIYSVIFIVYLAVAGRVSLTSLSFGVVAILSARVLSWQRNRLDLKTDKMRTAYLIAAFFIFPYALYQTVPSDYVSLSWLAVALTYYIISVVLKNPKYRWMALFTFLLTAFYLIIIGIIRLEPVFRIVSFLIVGIVLLAISFVYAKAKMKSGSKDS